VFWEIPPGLPFLRLRVVLGVKVYVVQVVDLYRPDISRVS
jgi:hypothetical protein